MVGWMGLLMDVDGLWMDGLINGCINVLMDGLIN